MLHVLQALHQLLAPTRPVPNAPLQVQPPGPGQLQASPEIQTPEALPANGRLLNNAQSPQNQLLNQNIWRVQPGGTFNQQQPQPGVDMHNLNYLAGLADDPFTQDMNRFNSLTQAQRAQELGLDKPVALGAPPALPSNYRPKSPGTRVNLR